LILSKSHRDYSAFDVSVSGCGAEVLVEVVCAVLVEVVCVVLVDIIWLRTKICSI